MYAASSLARNRYADAISSGCPKRPTGTFALMPSRTFSGITVNAVAPGFIETDMVAKMPENVLDGMRAKVPVGRLGQPEEIASAYLFLASEEAAYINGATLSVDGGMTI